MSSVKSESRQRRLSRVLVFFFQGKEKKFSVRLQNRIPFVCRTSPVKVIWILMSRRLCDASRRTWKKLLLASFIRVQTVANRQRNLWRHSLCRISASLRVAWAPREECRSRESLTWTFSLMRKKDFVQKILWGFHWVSRRNFLLSRQSYTQTYTQM